MMTKRKKMIAYDSNEDSLHTGVVRFIWYAVDSAHVLGQLVAIDYSDSTPDVAFTYDRQGRQLTVTDVLGTRTNVYDALNLLEERFPDGDAFVRTYDAFGRAAGIALGSDYAVGYGYDEYGRFSAVAVSNGATFTYSYVPDSSLLAGYTNDLGLAVAYAYEPHRDLKTLVSNAWSTNVISTFAYTYDPIGRRTARFDDGLTTNLFAYNLRSELTTAHMSTNLYAYTYDPIGNRTSASENGATTLYAANELNQYTNALAGGRAPTYDLDGNMTSDGTWSYAWDAENRLVGVSPRVLITGSRTYSYEYDHMGRRVKKIEKRHTMAESDWVVHTFDYDAWNLLRERIQAADAMATNQYIWGLDLSGTLAGAGGIGGLLASTLDGTNAFYTCDANGNITDLSAEDGALLGHYAYAPYGTPTAQSGPLAPLNPFRFSNKYNDPETTFYYYGYRFYSPWLGRWQNRDPIEEIGGLNVNAFVLGNPIRTVDPLGLRRFDCNTTRWHGEIAGGLLGYVGFAYDYETVECKCCKSDGGVGRYWRRYTEGTIKLAAGAGFDVDLGQLDWTWDFPFIGPVDYHLDMAFHFSISAIGVNHTFTHEMVEDDCNNIHTGPGRICWEPSLDMGIQGITVGNENFGLFARAYARFRGHYCIYISESGISLDDVSGEIAVVVNATIALAGSRHHMLYETIHFP